jgi:asparagine synthase (glutamine-hydrolysing)
MCGIAGIVRTGGRALPHPAVLRRMMTAIGHRGPDDSGEFIGPHVHLGTVRLAILDLKAGHQPVTTRGGDVVAVYNGEIYNYQALRSRLRAAGCPIATECDSEVIPYLFREEGAAMVESLRGMFAFAAWDLRMRKLMLCRDRLGIKPLYWARVDEFLLFASEIKGILASGLVQPRIDRDSLSDLFSISYPCPPRTMFVGINELRPGHLMEVDPDSGRVSIRRYWRAPFHPKELKNEVARSDAVHELRARIDASVYSHLQADVPVACYLSGGLDSSVICSSVKHVTGDSPKTFAVAFDDESLDESAIAASVATFLGTDHTTVRCTRHTGIALFETMIQSTELPLQFPIALPLYALSAAARHEGYKVVLSGEGPDELFGGYDCFRADALRRLFGSGALKHLRRLAYSQLYAWLGTPEGAVDVMIANHHRAPDIIRAFGGVYPPWYDVWTGLNLRRDELLAPGVGSARPISEPPDGFLELVHPYAKDLEPLDAALALEIETRLPSWILHIGDRASMANGVEARVPFLDHELVEFVCALPASFKIRRMEEKYLMRQAALQRLPGRIARRRKQPFYTPLAAWFFTEPLPDLVADHLSRDSLLSSDLFDPEIVRSFLDELPKVPSTSLRLRQLEWLLILILGTQVLHRSFIRAPRSTI